jgi:hypothetical protein
MEILGEVIAVAGPRFEGGHGDPYGTVRSQLDVREGLRLERAVDGLAEARSSLAVSATLR